MTIKPKNVLRNLFYVITAMFFILVALDAPQNSKEDSTNENSVATLTEKNENSNFN